MINILDIYIYIFNLWKTVCNPRFHEVFCKTTISISNSFHLLNCLMIVVLKKFMKPRVANYFPWIIHTHHIYIDFTCIKKEQEMVLIASHRLFYLSIKVRVRGMYTHSTVQLQVYTTHPFFSSYAEIYTHTHTH